MLDNDKKNDNLKKNQDAKVKVIKDSERNPTPYCQH